MFSFQGTPALKIAIRNASRGLPERSHPMLIPREASISGRNIACYFRLRCIASTIIHRQRLKMTVQDPRKYRRGGHGRVFIRAKNFIIPLLLLLCFHLSLRIATNWWNSISKLQVSRGSRDFKIRAACYWTTDRPWTSIAPFDTRNSSKNVRTKRVVENKSQY